MKASTFLSLLLLLCFSFQIISSAVVDDICSFVGDSYVDKEFCLKTLSSDPRSKTADADGLAVISVEIAVAKAAEVKTRIEAQLKGAADAYEKDRAQAALQIFSNVVSTFEWSVKSLKSKFRSGPLSLLTVGQDVVVTIDQLVDMGKLGNDFHLLGSLAAAIVRHLH
ncbi:putative invertase inhibitor [Musa acuminata AAA Group]|uniref:putative invertase inhibitor n=1 Tax=Musa acuminata AAA Group TaxID=214697 RepID=UPI0031CF4783